MARATRSDWLGISLIMLAFVFAPAAWVQLGARAAAIMLGIAVAAAAVAWFTARD